jgi:hypothetical protein
VTVPDSRFATTRIVSSGETAIASPFVEPTAVCAQADPPLPPVPLEVLLALEVVLALVLPFVVTALVEDVVTVDDVASPPEPPELELSSLHAPAAPAPAMKSAAMTALDLRSRKGRLDLGVCMVVSSAPGHGGRRESLCTGPAKRVFAPRERLIEQPLLD